MRYVLVATAAAIWTFLLLMPLAHGTETKFHFNDCVNVVSGFYKGCYGVVHQYDQPPKDAKPAYEVVLMCKGAQDMSMTFEEDEISLTKASRCKGAN